MSKTPTENFLPEFSQNTIEEMTKNTHQVLLEYSNQQQSVPLLQAPNIQQYSYIDQRPIHFQGPHAGEFISIQGGESSSHTGHRPPLQGSSTFQKAELIVQGGSNMKGAFKPVVQAGTFIAGSTDLASEKMQIHQHPPIEMSFKGHGLLGSALQNQAMVKTQQTFPAQSLVHGANFQTQRISGVQYLSPVKHKPMMSQTTIPPPPPQILLRPPNEVLKRSVVAPPPLPPMHRSVIVESPTKVAWTQPSSYNIVSNNVFRSPIQKKSINVSASWTTEIKAELQYAYFLLQCKSEELIAWKKHAKHLESHLQESGGGAMKLDTTALQSFERGFLALIEENKRVLSQLANQRDSPERIKRAGHPGPEVHAPPVDPLLESRQHDLLKRVKELEESLSQAIEENKKLHVMLEDKTDLVIRLQGEHKGGLAPLEERVKLMNKEILRLQEIIKGKDITHEQMEQELFRFKEEARGKLVLESEIKKLRDLLAARDRELQEFLIKQKNDFELIQRDYDQRVIILRQELEALGRKLQEKTLENDKLSFKIIELENLLKLQAGLGAENQRLTALLATRNQEIEEYRVKVQDFESIIADLRRQLLDSKDFQQQIARLKDENKSLLERLKRLEMEFESENARYKEEILSLRATIDQRTLELQTLKERLRDSNGLNIEISQKNIEIKDLRGQLELINKETASLKRLLEERSGENDNLKAELLRLQGLLSKSSGFELEVTRLKELLGNKEGILSGLQVQIQELSLKLQDKDGKLSEFSLKVKGLEDSLRLMKGNYDEKSRELSDLQAKYESLTISFESKSSNLTGKDKEIKELWSRITQFEATKGVHGQLESQIDDLNKVITQKDQEINDFRSKIHALTLQISDLSGIKLDLEARNRLLNEQNEGLKGEINKKTTLINEYSMKIETLSASLDEKSGAVNDNDKKNLFLMSSITELKASNSRITQEKDELLAIIEDNNRKIAELKRMLDEKTRELNEKLIIITDLEGKILLISGDLEKKNQALEQKSREITEWSVKYTEIQGTLDSKSGVLLDYEARIALLTSEISRLKNLIKNKESEIESLKFSIENLNREISGLGSSNVGNETRIQQINGELIKITGNLEVRNRELADLRDRHNKLSIELEEKSSFIIELETQIDRLKRENERLAGNLKAKTGELEQALKRLSDLELEYNSKLTIINQYESRISLSSSDQERNKGLLAQKDQEVMLLKETINDLKASVSSMTIIIKESEEKITILTNQNGDLQGQLLSITTRFTEMEGKYSESSTLILKLQADIEGYLRRIRELEGIVEKMTKEIEAKDTRIMELENTVAMFSGELNRVKRMVEKQKGEIEGYLFSIREFETSSSSMTSRMQELETSFYRVNESHFMNLGLMVQMAAEIEELRGRVFVKAEETAVVEQHSGGGQVIEEVIVKKTEKVIEMKSEI